MSLIWNPDRRQLTGPVQLGEVDRIPSVGLDPITGLARDQRRSDHDVSVPCRAELPLYAVTAWSGLVAEPQPPRANFAASAFKAAGVFATLPYSRTSLRMPRNRVLVHIQTSTR